MLEPILEQVGDRLEAELLLPRVWQALGVETREHLGRCTVLSAPAPWGVIRELEAAEGTGRALVDAGLLSPFQASDEAWWAPHRLVSETVAGLWQGDVAEAHRRVGRWFQVEFEEKREVALAQRAVEHLCAAGDGDGAWPTAEAVVLWLRGAGRYREALAWVERVLDARASGHQRGIALAYRVQLRRLSGSLLRSGETELEEALELVAMEQRGFVFGELGAFCMTLGRLAEASSHHERAVEAKIASQGEDSADVATSLHELAGVLQAQGDLSGARERLERSLAIKSSVFGTEEHPEVAASLHSLAVVLQAQGDLSGAREMLERVLEIEEHIYGTRDHYSTAITEMMLGFLLQELEEAEAAARLLEHAYGVFLKQLGPDHPNTRRLAPLFEQGAEPDAED